MGNDQLAALVGVCFISKASLVLARMPIPYGAGALIYGFVWPPDEEVSREIKEEAAVLKLQEKEQADTIRKQKAEEDEQRERKLKVGGYAWHVC